MRVQVSLWSQKTVDKGYFISYIMSKTRYFSVNVAEVSKLYDPQDYVTPTLAMIGKIMSKQMNFLDARECVDEIYMKRGYVPACDFIDMLSGYDLITLDDRTTLKEYIRVIEEAKIEAKRQKKLANKYRKI